MRARYSGNRQTFREALGLWDIGIRKYYPKGLIWMMLGKW
jgi:hypothetical protein